MARQKGLTILIDNATLGHGVTHESVWISTGVKRWGAKIPIETGYRARVPIHRTDNASDIYREVRYLVGIAALAKSKHLRLVSSVELQVEASRHPRGTFFGYSGGDLSLFKDIDLPLIDGESAIHIESRKQQSARLALVNEEPFRSLLTFFPGDDFDAWHIHTASKYRLHCFLTMDLKLIRKFRQASKRSGFPKLNTRVLLPSELALELGLRPIDTYVVTYEDLPFFGRHDLYMPAQKRTSRAAFRKRD